MKMWPILQAVTTETKKKTIFLKWDDELGQREDEKKREKKKRNE